MDKLSTKIPPPPDPVREPRNYHDWVLTYHVRRFGIRKVKSNQFHRWLWPLSPTYSADLDAAVRKQDWTKVRAIVTSLRDSYNTEEGLVETDAGKQSNHEFVIRDIFLIAGIKFNYQVPVTMKNGRSIVVDFEFPSTRRYFEIYGVRRDPNYQVLAMDKAQNMSERLWWLDMMTRWLPGEKASLLSYADLLDTSICHKNNCNLPLFNQSVMDAVCNKVVLLKGANLSMCKNYLIQMGMMSDEDKDVIRSQVSGTKGMQDKAPKYFVPPNATRDETGNLVHPLTPGYAKTPLFASTKFASAAPTLKQIEEELSAKYHSVRMWTDEEKVAVYFETPQRLMDAFKSHLPMQRAAGNWYQMIKIYSKIPQRGDYKGVITFDFDRTLTIPHVDDNGRYLFYGTKPNLPMIEKFKQYAARGYEVGIVTARTEGLEPPRGELVNDYGQPVLGVYDLIDQFDLPCSFVHFTNNNLKAPLLKELGVKKHYDDSPRECDGCDDHGIDYEQIFHKSDQEHGFGGMFH